MEFFFLTVGNAPSVIYTRKKGGGELIGSVCFLVCTWLFFGCTEISEF